MIHKINKTIQDGLNKVIKQISKIDIYDVADEPEKSIQPYNEENDYDEDDNPYEAHSWSGAKWFCIRCGGELKEIPKNDPSHGDYCWKTMRRTGTCYYQCSNDKCFHHSAPLVLHHPVYGYDRPAGDSYSISWIK